MNLAELLPVYSDHRIEKLAMLWHYTSLGSAQSIVSTGTLRAFHFRQFESDPQELAFGLAELQKAIRQISVSEDDRPYQDHLLAFTELFADSELEVYVVSFTETPDSLHHWRTYASRGVAIGFDGDRILKGFSKAGDLSSVPDLSNRYLRCRYEDAFDMSAYVAKSFFTPNSYPAMFRSGIVSTPWFELTLAVSVYQAICSIKRKRFEGDAEHRCFHVFPKPEHYPVKTTDAGKRYIEMCFAPQEFVREIQIAPDAGPDTYEAVRTFIDQDALRCTLTRSQQVISGTPF